MIRKGTHGNKHDGKKREALQDFRLHYEDLAKPILKVSYLAKYHRLDAAWAHGRAVTGHALMAGTEWGLKQVTAALRKLRRTYGI